MPPRVLILTPVKEAAHHLDRYLAGLDRLTYHLGVIDYPPGVIERLLATGKSPSPRSRSDAENPLVRPGWAEARWRPRASA